MVSDAEDRYLKTLSTKIDHITSQGKKPIFMFESFMGWGSITITQTVFKRGHKLIQKAVVYPLRMKFKQGLVGLETTSGHSIF